MELQSSMPPLNFLHCLIKLLNVEDSPNFYGYLCLISSVCSNCLRIIQILLDRRSLLHSVKRFGEITLLFFNCLQISFSETLQNCPILALFISEQWVFELSNLQLQL